MNGKAVGMSIVYVLILVALLAVGIYFSAKNTKNDTLHAATDGAVSDELAIHHELHDTMIG